MENNKRSKWFRFLRETKLLKKRESSGRLPESSIWREDKEEECRIVGRRSLFSRD